MIKVFTEDNALELAERLLQNDKDIKDEFEQKEYATETFVTNAIANAQLSGGDVDLSGYASKDDLDNYALKSQIPSLDGYAKTEDIPDEYDDTTLSNRITTVENDYLKSSDKTELTQAIATAKTETIETILGESVDADFDTLQEVADWIQSDTTASAELVIRVTNAESDIATIQNDYLKSVDKTELLSSISTNAIAIEENTEAIADNTTAIAVERARIDAFTVLPEGSTTGDAALEDIKIKADGTTSDTAGNAVREQINTLDDKIDEEVSKLSSEIVNLKNSGLYLSSYPDLELEWELGSININNGVNYEEEKNSSGEYHKLSTNRIRTKNQVFIPKGTKIGLLDYSIFSYTACLYDKNGVFKSSISSAWITSDTLIQEECYIRFSVRYNDNREINTTVTALNGGVYGLGNLLKVLKPSYFQDILDSRWCGKNIIVYGDSISDDDKFGIKKYCSFVANWLDCGIKNTAVGGAGFYNWAYSETDSLLEQSKIDYGSNYDLVIIFAGTNDYGNNGGVEEIVFTDAVKTVIDNLRVKYPLSKFLIATPLRRNGGEVANSKGMVLNDYCEIIRNVSKEKGFALLDLYNMGNFFADSEVFVNTYTYNADGLHPTEEWHKNTLAFQFLNAIRGL